MSRSNFWCLAEQRRLITGALADVSGDTWYEIPPYRKNNIAWNLGHIVTVQQMLTYRLSGLEMNLPAEYVDLYGRNTDPSGWTGRPDPTELLEKLDTLCTVTATDYEAGKFKEFSEFTTSTGVHITSIDEAIAFNNFHEGIHLGVILSIKRELAAAKG